MEAPSEGTNYALVLGPAVQDSATEAPIDIRAIVADAYRAQLAGDVDAWWSIFHHDVAFFEAASLPYGCAHDNLEAAKRTVDEMLRTWVDFRVEIEELTVGRNLVIAYVQMSGKSRATGRSFSFPAAEVFRFDGAKVVEWRPIYWDTHEIRSVTGMSTAA